MTSMHVLRPITTQARMLSSSPSDQAPQESTSEDKKALLRDISLKAVGPDGIPGRVLKDCTNWVLNFLTQRWETVKVGSDV